MDLLALAHHNAGRLAELGFLLMASAGFILAFGFIGGFLKRNTAAGLALAVGSVLLIVAFHWGHY
jgi:hypothetical protein